LNVSVKIPGPDHPITIAPNANRVRLVLNGRTVADTTRALTLKEASNKPVLYIPREDADMSLLERTDHTTHCPYKGDASYYSIRAGDRLSENAAWSYEQPYPAMNQIAGYLNRVDAIEELPIARSSQAEACART
jgi:uncharacterized protein (DUF427 family)